MRTTGSGVGRGVAVGNGVEVGLGPAVMVGMAVGRGTGSAWQAEITKMIQSQTSLFIGFMQTL